MKSPKYLPVAVLAVLLAACLFTVYSTRDAGSGPLPKKATTAEKLVDTSLLEMETRLAPLAATAEEQALAHEAWRLADHELDMNFAAALRAAQAEAQAEAGAAGATKAANGPLQQMRDRVAKLAARVAADKERVAALSKSAGGESDLAQAQLDLDQDELDDAQQDLAREGGDQRAKLQRLLQEHEASDKLADQAVKFKAPGAMGTMSEQVGAWLSLREGVRELQAAAQQANAHAQAMLAQLGALEQQLRAQPDAGTAGASVARLKQLSAQQKTLTGLDERAQDTKALAAAYQSWIGLMEGRQRAALHLLLRSLAGILGIVLATMLLNLGIRHAIGRAKHGTDRHRLHQLHVIVRVAMQVAALLGILLIVFGPPTQLSTIIGLLTAGFTVVMKDFIVAFFGWFTLMGKNGISVGDWVEIEGVSGAVIEIGLLKTVLLELGNWTEVGHPTGRRVAFSNSFAMEGHYFNFSTSSQWLWDELQFTLPAEGDPYETAHKIRELVERETRADAAEAGKDWQSVTHRYGTREFSAAPAVNLRPGANGLEVVVRYIARAPQRNVVKAKLFDAVVDVLRKGGTAAPAGSAVRGAGDQPA